MQGLKLRQILRQFRQERIGEDFRHLFVSGAAAVANQLADIDFECACQSLQRTEGRDRFAVLNFGDVGAGNLHAAGQLALTQVTSLPDVLDLRGYPETRVEIACGTLAYRDDFDRGWSFFHVQWLVSSPAHGVAGPELNESAMFAAQYLALLCRSETQSGFRNGHLYQCRRHNLFAESQSKASV